MNVRPMSTITSRAVKKGPDIAKLIRAGNKFLEEGRDQVAKDQIEKVLKNHDIESPVLHFQCGLAN